MSTREVVAALAAAAVLSGCALGDKGGMPATGAGPAAKPLGIGRTATPQEIAGWNIDVRSDGQGLPPGRGTVAAGKQVYEAKCVACHGEAGKGASAPALAGGVGSLATPKPRRTIGSFWPYASTVFDYIYRAMPWDKPMSLSHDEVYSVTAYLLSLDRLVPPDAVLDPSSLPKVAMPNRNGFIPPDDRAKVSGTRCMRDC